MTLVYELIFLVLIPASLFDLWQYRVPNALCFAALVISLIGHLDRISAAGISFWLAGKSFRFLSVLYFTFATYSGHPIVN